MSYNSQKPNKCSIATAIIVFLALFIYIFPPLIIFFIIIFFKTDLSVAKLLQVIWVYDCIQKNEKPFWYNKETYNEKVNIAIEKLKNKRNDKNKKQYDRLIEMFEQAKTQRDTERKEKREIKYTNSRVVQTQLPTQIKSKIKPSKPAPYKHMWQTKQKSYDYNGGKSIWDDYESVIDTMNKNKQ